MSVKIAFFLLIAVACRGVAEESAPSRPAPDSLPAPGMPKADRSLRNAVADRLLSDSIAVKKQEIASMRAAALSVTAIGG